MMCLSWNAALPCEHTGYPVMLLSVAVQKEAVGGCTCIRGGMCKSYHLSVGSITSDGRNRGEKIHIQKYVRVYK